MSFENNKLTGRIINAIITVHQELGPGCWSTLRARRQISAGSIWIRIISPYLLSLHGCCHSVREGDVEIGEMRRCALVGAHESPGCEGLGPHDRRLAGQQRRACLPLANCDIL